MLGLGQLDARRFAMSVPVKEEKAPAVPEPAFGDWLGHWFARSWPRFWPELRLGLGEDVDLLRVEEFTEGEEIVVRAEMPGIDPDKDVQITVSDHTLRLRAERRHETETEEKGSYRSEFQYGSFTRTLQLPPGATEKDVRATYKDGILEVRIPVDRKEAQAKKIPIQRT
jgi:HSP20 family protein